MIGVSSLPAGNSRAWKLAQRFGLGIDSHDRQPRAQQLDHVPAIAAAEIDGQRVRRGGPKRSSATSNVFRGGRSRSFS